MKKSAFVMMDMMMMYMCMCRMCLTCRVSDPISAEGTDCAA